MFVLFCIMQIKLNALILILFGILLCTSAIIAINSLTLPLISTTLFTPIPFSDISKFVLQYNFGYVFPFMHQYTIFIYASWLEKNETTVARLFNTFLGFMLEMG